MKRQGFGEDYQIQQPVIDPTVVQHIVAYMKDNIRIVGGRVGPEKETKTEEGVKMRRRVRRRRKEDERETKIEEGEKMRGRVGRRRREHKERRGSFKGKVRDQTIEAACC